MRGGRFEIGAVGEHDLRRLAAELQAHALEVALPGILHQQPADRARAGERDHVDVHMQGERLAGVAAEAGNDIEHARRHAGFERQLAELQAR